VLSFDLEARAAGYADPNWVPQRITAYAYSWLDEVHIEAQHLKEGYWDRHLRGQLLLPLVEAMTQENVVVTGHNILRYDLPLLNAELILGGLPPLPKLRVIDTMKLPKTKGLKKGQDNLAVMVETTTRKQPMDWMDWDNAYAEPDWATVISRVKSDVQQHKELFTKLRPLLKERSWRP
jgi:hypothetical protein